MSKLIVSTSARAYSDAAASNNPLRRNFDWSRSMTVSVMNPRSTSDAVEAGGTHTIFDGTRTTSLDGTTALTVSSPLAAESSRYRFTWVSGTDPVLRTTRSLALSGQTLTVTANADQTATFSIGAGSFGSTALGDQIFVPGPSTGDAATPLNALNEGFWVVIAVLSSTRLQLARPSGTTFQAASEVVALTSNSQLQAASAAGVQVADRVSISAGFSTQTLRTYSVDRVTAAWFEVVSSSAIPLESAKLPGAAGLTFYSSARSFLRVEADQEVGLRINGASQDTVRLSPWQPGDPEQPAWFELVGPTFRLDVLNRSTQVANIEVFSAE